MIIKKEILEADELLNEATGVFSFTYINPINYSLIRKKFFSNKLKNPDFNYAEPNKNLIEIKRKISSLNLEGGNFLEDILIKKKHDVLNKINLLLNVGCRDFSEKSKDAYGIPKKRLVNKAYDIINEKNFSEKTKKLGHEESSKLLKKNIKLFDMGYRLYKRDLVTSCLIEPSKKQIFLKKHHRYSKRFLNRLIVHEIGTHAFRYENGHLQRLNIFKNGFADYLDTEEGLAAYNEEKYGLLTQKKLRNYAGRVVAVHNALEKDFYKTYKEVKKYFDKNTAFNLTLRAKRGLPSGSDVGAFTKDIVYLKGYYKVKNFVRKGGNINDLYYGKIGVDDIELIKKLELVYPEFLPKKFIFSD